MILPYIINVALILATCLVFYRLLLRRETFYKVNRYVLITCLAISFALPMLQVPQQFSLRKDHETSDVNRESSIVNQSGVGSSESTVNDKKQAPGSQQSAPDSYRDGSREPATGNREQATG